MIAAVAAATATFLSLFLARDCLAAIVVEIRKLLRMWPPVKKSKISIKGERAYCYSS